MGLVAHVLVALGLDVRWVISALLTLLVTALIVVLIVIETVAGVLTGTTENQGSGQTGAALAAKLAPIPRSTLSPTTDWDLGTRVLELAQSWLGVPYVSAAARGRVSIAAVWWKTCTRPSACICRVSRWTSTTQLCPSAFLSRETSSFSRTRTNPEFHTWAST
jgi:hypothetical protein